MVFAADAETMARVKARYEKWKGKYGDGAKIGGSAYNDLVAKISEAQDVAEGAGRRSVTARMKRVKKSILEYVGLYS